MTVIQSKIESGIPQQEIFLQVPGPDDSNARIYLDEIEDMSDQVLHGFREWMIAKQAEMFSQEEIFRERYKMHDLSRDECSQFSALKFKISIFKFFYSEIVKEILERKKAAKAWTKQIKEREGDNSPCPWLAKFGLPTTMGAFGNRVYNSERAASRLQRFINLVRDEIAEDKFNEIMEKTRVDEIQGEAFLNKYTRSAGIQNGFL